MLVIPYTITLGRHFEKLFKAISQPYVNDMAFSLSLLLEGGIMLYKDLVQEVSGAASGEAALEDSLAKIENSWVSTQFVVLNHRDQHGLYILGSLEEIFTLLEDNQVTLQQSIR